LFSTTKKQEGLLILGCVAGGLEGEVVVVVRRPRFSLSGCGGYSTMTEKGKLVIGNGLSRRGSYRWQRSCLTVEVTMMACLVWKGGSSDAIEKMKRANGFKFCGFRVKERLMALFCFGKGEVVVGDAGCTVEIESAEFFFC
jgi:hypothetical protein